jgi:hypothetical protein
MPCPKEMVNDFLGKALFGENILIVAIIHILIGTKRSKVSKDETFYKECELSLKQATIVGTEKAKNGIGRVKEEIILISFNR